MNYKLYLNKDALLGNADTPQEANKIINDYLENIHFKSYYFNICAEETKVVRIDYGSHSNFIYLYCKNKKCRDSYIFGDETEKESEPSGIINSKNKNAISWKEYFMGIAELSAKRSKDPKTQVGACLVNKANHIISIGYNGLPFGMNDDNFPWDSDEKHKYVVHAEANAILNCNSDMAGSTLYVTMFPCNECAKLLVQKHIEKIIYKDDKFLEKESGKAALEMFEAANIKIEKYENRIEKENL